MPILAPDTSTIKTAAGSSRQRGSKEALELLFKLHYTGLCRYCLRYVKQGELAEEIVQDTFVAFWEKDIDLPGPSAAKAYLYTAVRNRSINYLKSAHARQQFQGDDPLLGQLATDTTQEQLDFQELSVLVEAGIEKLPERCRTIFEMSRLGGFSYQEIAAELALSPKTVENQMGIALRKLKEYLSQYWDLIPLLFITLRAYEWTLFHL